METGTGKCCLNCACSLSGDAPDGSQVLVCFDCVGFEGKEVIVGEDEVCENYKDYDCATDKTDKTDPKTQNPEKDIDIEKDIDKEIESLHFMDKEAFDFEYNCFLESGFAPVQAKRCALEAINMTEE